MTSYLSQLVSSGSHDKGETRMGTSRYDVYDVYLWILICVYSVVSHPCVIISMLIVMDLSSNSSFLVLFELLFFSFAGICGVF